MPAIKPTTQHLSQKALERKNTKPIMEKKRRARINNSLNELKNLILDFLKKDPSRQNKLEKADILDMTVKFLQSLPKNSSPVADADALTEFYRGYNECSVEVGRYLSQLTETGSTNQAVASRLFNHLNSRLNNLKNIRTHSSSSSYAVNFEVQNSIAKSQIHLVPTRLPSGQFALVLPSTNLPSKSAEAMHTSSSSPLSSASSLYQISSCTSPASPLSTSQLSPTNLSTSRTINVLGSSGILSPAASDRSGSPTNSLPEPLSLCAPTLYEPISPVGKNVEPLNLNIHCNKFFPSESMEMWRPW